MKNINSTLPIVSKEIVNKLPTKIDDIIDALWYPIEYPLNFVKSGRTVPSFKKNHSKIFFVKSITIDEKTELITMCLEER